MSAGNGTDAQPPRKDYFGERVAELYDESTAAMFEPAVVDPAVDLLAELAGDRAALELGIGTGRIALPLTRFRAVDGRFVKRSIPFRYVWPSELDLMARIAGMTLRDRFGGWEREPFTSESTKHVSVWQMSTEREEGSRG
jgi:hypothetical protein